LTGFRPNREWRAFPSGIAGQSVPVSRLCGSYPLASSPTDSRPRQSKGTSLGFRYAIDAQLRRDRTFDVRALKNLVA
jgi:hypothetical protein